MINGPNVTKALLKRSSKKWSLALTLLNLSNTLNSPAQKWEPDPSAHAQIAEIG